MVVLSKQESKRSIRIFVSSTFKDMVAERDELMSHCWPELRRFCKERYLELIEVDLRWGISEEQDKRKETLKLCLNEIHECRPFFIGLLGERYGWIPDKEVYNPDILEEQSWLRDLKDRSVTELEIMHGVLNNPNLTGRAFFYFRDPNYIKGKGQEFISENEEAENKQKALKEKIKSCCRQHSIPLKENYNNAKQLALDILEDLKLAIEKAYPLELVPDSLTRESLEHEAFAESRRKTYIGRQSYFDRLDKHVTEEGTPLVITGESGIGKSALLANWSKLWKEAHGDDFIFQHYIGGTTQSGDHWALMNRLMSEIKRWTDDPSELPKSHDEILRDFGSWLVRLRIKAEQNNVNAILVIDALNQLEDKDNSHILGWLPDYPFFGSLRLILTTTKNNILEILEKRNWKSFEVSVLGVSERKQMIVDYLTRFSKKLDEKYLNLICSSSQAENPLFVKILLDELRITGTHEKLEERICFYLDAESISNLLDRILDRYQKDYDKDRPNLVEESLGLIWSARRGLSEQELLELLKPDDQPQLPHAIWNPLRSALAEFLIDKNGILNFSHDFLKIAVEKKFVFDQEKQDDFRLQLADYFERIPITERSCDELPWLLKETESFERLRTNLIDINRFFKIYVRNKDELRSYWIILEEEIEIGNYYLESFNLWLNSQSEFSASEAIICNYLGLFLNDFGLFNHSEQFFNRVLSLFEMSNEMNHPFVAYAMSNLAQLLGETNRYQEAESLFIRSIDILEKSNEKDNQYIADVLSSLAYLFRKTNRHQESEPLCRRVLELHEKTYGRNHPKVAHAMIQFGEILNITNRYKEAEAFFRNALDIFEKSFSKDHIDISMALYNLAELLGKSNRLHEAEPLFRRALDISEKIRGENHPEVSTVLNGLAELLTRTNRHIESEPYYRRALEIAEKSFGKDHPNVATILNNLAEILSKTNRHQDAEFFYRRALEITEKSFGKDHPNVAVTLNNLAQLLYETNRHLELEPYYRRALEISEKSFGNDHPSVALILNNLAQLLVKMNRQQEAEPYYKRALEITERSYGNDHPNVAVTLNNFAQLLGKMNRQQEAEPYYRRALEIAERSFGNDHPLVAKILNNLAEYLREINHYQESELQFKRCLTILEKNSGIEDRSLLVLVLSNLGDLLNYRSRSDEAEQLYKRILQLSEKNHEREKPYISSTLFKLAELCRRTSRYNESEAFLMRILEIFESNFGNNHTEVANILNHLAQLYSETMRLQEAEQLFRKALIIYEENYGNNHPSVATTLNNLAQILSKTRFYQESERFYIKSLAIYEKVYDCDHPLIAAALNNYASLLLQTNRAIEAKTLIEKSLEILLLFSRKNGYFHFDLHQIINNYQSLHLKLGYSREDVMQHLFQIAPELFSRS